LFIDTRFYYVKLILAIKIVDRNADTMYGDTRRRCTTHVKISVFES